MKWRNILLIAGLLGLSATLLFAFIRMEITQQPVWIWEPNFVIRYIEMAIFAGWIVLSIERAIWLVRSLIKVSKVAEVQAPEKE